MEDLATREAASIHVAALLVTPVITVKQVGYNVSRIPLSISHCLNFHPRSIKLMLKLVLMSEGLAVFWAVFLLWLFNKLMNYVCVLRRY